MIPCLCRRPPSGGRTGATMGNNGLAGVLLSKVCNSGVGRPRETPPAWGMGEKRAFTTEGFKLNDIVRDHPECS